MAVFRSICAIVLCATIVLVTSCGSGMSDATNSSNDADSTEIPATTTTTIPEIPEYRSFIATAKQDVALVDIYADLNETPFLADVNQTGTEVAVSLANPNDKGVPLTFLVKTPNVDSANESFHEVFLPVRPNESVGWIHTNDVDLTYTDYRIDVSLSSFTLAVFNGNTELATFPIATGTDAAPTPVGTYYIEELVSTTEPEGQYGPFAFGLSGHSDVINNEQFPDGVIGIHGTNEPGLIGSAASSGCVRMNNEDIIELVALKLPLGTPVTIEI